MTLERFARLVGKVVDNSIQLSNGTMVGLIASPPYEAYGGFQEDLGDPGGAMWVVDVDVGAANGEPLKAVPIATNNRDIFYADIGKAVTLTRMYNGQWVVTGLSKTATDVTEIIEYSFADDLVTVVKVKIPTVRRRALTFEEIGAIKPFGTIPLGAWGVFDYDGNFIKLVEV